MYDQTLLVLVPIFFAISFVYSSVGFGGGSSYTAILILAGISIFSVPPISLVLNVIVSCMAFLSYIKAQYFSPKLSLPFLSSIPFAFYTGQMILPQKTIIIIFIITLFAASAALLTSKRATKNQQESETKRSTNLNYIKMAIIGIPIGALLGSVAGLVGIGGGIWLSPLLILTGLANPKQSAATASLFILTNSISGFAAHSISKPLDLYFLLPLACVVLAGGIIGSRLGAFRFDHDKIRMIIGAIVAVAAINLTIKLLV
ncbi:MAG TPA: sulfite exporter TauE/SafE family protein [Nitrososphaeraceae archaeon]|nr:sulfite exporter TauE/SafE family protein [Nitrososphaeraceae archaeon]